MAVFPIYPFGGSWMVMGRILQTLLIMSLFILDPKVYGAENRYILSTQAMALAPNAGGQRSYGLRVARNAIEYGGFANAYLTVDGRPIMGATANYRFSFCKKNCWWELFAQIGGGGSTAGPLLEATWGLMAPVFPIWWPGFPPKYMPMLRVDITSQMFFVQWRGITWSYPLWAGISMPI